MRAPSSSPKTRERGLARVSLALVLTVSAGALTSEECQQQPPTQDAIVCYPGANERYDTCFQLDPMPVPPPADYVYPSTCEASYGSNYQTPESLLDLTTTDPSIYLAPNFQLGELAQEWKGQYAVLQVHAVESLQDVRDIVGVLYINSGYRSPAYNASVGGATCSRHMYGDAFDMASPDSSLSGIASACRSAGADFIQVYDTFVHCDWRYGALDDAYYRTAGAIPSYDDLPKLAARLAFDGSRWTAPATGWDEGAPLRQWTAYDRSGRILLEATGETFVAPPGTAEVEVVVGAELVLRATIPQTP